MPATKAQASWYRQHSKMVSIKLTERADADIIAKLGEQPSVQGYIKALIRADIAKTATT